MTKAKISILTAICVLAVCATIFAVASLGKKPFQNWDSSRICAAQVTFSPPDKTLCVTDTQKLAQLLSSVVIYQQDNSYTEYTGQSVTFTILQADGTLTSVMAYNPFVVIDGVGYRTKYEPCEALNDFGNDLLYEGEAPTVVRNPPALSVVSDHTAAEAVIGSYSWTRTNLDGSSESLTADSPHPLNCRDLLTLLDTTQGSAALQFAEEPDEILEIRCWSNEHWDDVQAPGEPVSVIGNEVTLKPGGHIYQALARWDTQGRCGGGTAAYYFYIDFSPFV